MGNVIKIKRGTTAKLKTGLQQYEMGFSTNEKCLFIGEGSNSAIPLKSYHILSNEYGNQQYPSGWPDEGLQINRVKGENHVGNTITSTSISIPVNNWHWILRFAHYGVTSGNLFCTDLGIPMDADSGIQYIRYNSLEATSGATATSTKGWIKVLDSNNFSSYALPLSGGTLTGKLKITKVTDADPSKNASLELIASDELTKVQIDNNEILALTRASTSSSWSAGNLFLQANVKIHSTGIYSSPTSPFSGTISDNNLVVNGIVIHNTKWYGTAEPGNQFDNPVNGQIYFKVVS